MEGTQTSTEPTPVEATFVRTDGALSKTYTYEYKSDEAPPSESIPSKSSTVQASVVPPSLKTGKGTAVTNAISKSTQKVKFSESRKSTTSSSPKPTPKRGKLQMKDFRSFGPNTTPRKSRIDGVNQKNPKVSDILRIQYEASKLKAASISSPEQNSNAKVTASITVGRSTSRKEEIKSENYRIPSPSPTRSSNGKSMGVISLSPSPTRKTLINAKASSGPAQTKTKAKALVSQTPVQIHKKTANFKARESPSPSPRPSLMRKTKNTKIANNPSLSPRPSPRPSPRTSSTGTKSENPALVSTSDEQNPQRFSRNTKFQEQSNLKIKPSVRAGLARPKPIPLRLPEVAERKEVSNFLNPTIASQLKARASRNTQRSNVDPGTVSPKSLDVAAAPGLLNIFMVSTSHKVHSPKASETSLTEAKSTFEGNQTLCLEPEPMSVSSKVLELGEASAMSKDESAQLIAEQNKPTLTVIHFIPPASSSSEVKLDPAEALNSTRMAKETQSPLSHFKTPIQPEIPICDAFPCTPEWNLYWLNFQTALNKYLREMDTYDEGISAFQEDIQRYTNSGQVMRLEQKSDGAVEAKALTPRKETFPSTVTYPLEGIHVLHGYVVKGQNILGTVSTVAGKTTGILVEVDLRAVNRDTILMQMEPDAIILTAGSVNRFMRIGCPEGIRASEIKISPLVDGIFKMEGP